MNQCGGLNMKMLIFKMRLACVRNIYIDNIMSNGVIFFDANVEIRHLTHIAIHSFRKVNSPVIENKYTHDENKIHVA